MPNIEWVEELPPRPSQTKASRRADAIVERLKKTPGKWALVEPNAKHRESVRRYTRRDCEAAARENLDTGGYDIYARWPATDLAAVDPYLARRRARGIPPEGAKRV